MVSSKQTAPRPSPDCTAVRTRSGRTAVKPRKQWQKAFITIKKQWAAACSHRPSQELKGRSPFQVCFAACSITADPWKSLSVVILPCLSAVYANILLLLRSVTDVREPLLAAAWPGLPEKQQDGGRNVFKVHYHFECCKLEKVHKSMTTLHIHIINIWSKS